jgi:hypothetical protein
MAPVFETDMRELFRRLAECNNRRARECWDTYRKSQEGSPLPRAGTRGIRAEPRRRPRAGALAVHAASRKPSGAEGGLHAPGARRDLRAAIRAVEVRVGRVAGAQARRPDLVRVDGAARVRTVRNGFERGDLQVVQLQLLHGSTRFDVSDNAPARAGQSRTDWDSVLKCAIVPTATLSFAPGLRLDAGPVSMRALWRGRHRFGRAERS